MLDCMHVYRPGGSNLTLVRQKCKNIGTPYPLSFWIVHFIHDLICLVIATSKLYRYYPGGIRLIYKYDEKIHSVRICLLKQERLTTDHYGI